MARWQNMMLVLLFSLIANIAFCEQSLPQFKIMTERWPPYQFVEDGVLKGISIDVFTEMLARVGSSQGLDDIAIYPWKRAYQTVLNQPNTVVFLMTRIKDREDLFKWVGPLFSNTTHLFMKNGNTIQIKNEAELKNYRYGVVRDDVGEQLLLGKGVPKKQIYRSVNNEDCLKMLLSGRLDLVAQSGDGIRAEVVDLGIDPAMLESAFVLNVDTVCYAFHKDTSEAIIDKFQTVFDQMKKTGEIEAIFDKYQKYQYVW